MEAYIVIPTYNERDNLEHLIPEVMALEPQFHLLIVDDNSPDGTSDRVAELQATWPRLHLLRRAGKLGFASAEIAGLRQALEQQPDYVIHMDADFSHHPRYLPEMIATAEREQADVTIGSRYVAGGGTRNWGLGRQILSRGANFTARTLLGLRVDDCTSGFRCYRASVLADFDFGQVTVDGYSYLVEMTYLFTRRGCRFAQVPIIFEDRLRGKSKISKRIIFEAMRLVFRRAWGRLSGRG
ncbi:MAG: polyprenol monophosphomannose synthase [Fimbriimonadaceae bacterium]|nr:polyprenol monophosphomannose synthase [Fimbriimonadaceae bacterium]